jgi:hypothetical protein
MTKTEAIDKVLRVINNRLAIMSKPMREEAYALCFEYQLTANDLLGRMEERALNV